MLAYEAPLIFLLFDAKFSLIQTLQIFPAVHPIWDFLILKGPNWLNKYWNPTNESFIILIKKSVSYFKLTLDSDSLF